MKVNAVTLQKLVEIGTMIRAARERADVSQATLAAKVGMFRENYLRIEKGRVNLTVETLMRIADGLGFDLVFVLKARPRTRRAERERIPHVVHAAKSDGRGSSRPVRSVVR